MRTFNGEVISTKMDKTATVLVERVAVHPVYKKRYKKSKKYHVHDPFGVEAGQTVEFVPSKPYSKLKKWIVTKVFDSEGNLLKETTVLESDGNKISSDKQTKKRTKKSSKGLSASKRSGSKSSGLKTKKGKEMSA